MLAVALPATVGAQPARTQGGIDIVAPTPGAVVGPGTVAVRIDLVLRGADPSALIVIVDSVGARRHRRHDISDRFTIVTTGGETHATADIGVHELGAGITQLSARAHGAHATTRRS